MSERQASSTCPRFLLVTVPKRIWCKAHLCPNSTHANLKDRLNHLWVVFLIEFRTWLDEGHWSVRTFVCSPAGRLAPASTDWPQTDAASAPGENFQPLFRLGPRSKVRSDAPVGPERGKSFWSGPGRCSAPPSTSRPIEWASTKSKTHWLSITAQWGSIRCKHNIRWQHLSQMKDVLFQLA